MLEPVSVALKFGFLAVLYLFLLWVARSAREGPAPARRRRAERGAGHRPRTRPASTPPRPRAAAADDDDREPRLVVERAPGHEPGMSYDIGDGAVLGRGERGDPLEDPFASSRHARSSREGASWSRGPRLDERHYLNEEPLDGPQPLHPGDRIRIGDSEFIYAQ